MPPNLKDLSILKVKMMEEKEISVAYTYFFDHFGEDPAFFDLSKPARHPLMEAVLSQVVGGMIGLKGPTAMTTQLILLNIPGHSFYHGTFAIGGYVVTFIYFDDIQLGCVAAAATDGRLGTQFLRVLDRDAADHAA